MILVEAAWRFCLVVVLWWMFRPHWPAASTQEVMEGLAFLFLAVLALRGKIGDRD